MKFKVESFGTGVDVTGVPLNFVSSLETAGGSRLLLTTREGPEFCFTWNSEVITPWSKNLAVCFEIAKQKIKDKDLRQIKPETLFGLDDPGVRRTIDRLQRGDRVLIAKGEVPTVFEWASYLKLNLRMEESLTWVAELIAGRRWACQLHQSFLWGHSVGASWK